MDRVAGLAAAVSFSMDLPAKSLPCPVLRYAGPVDMAQIEVLYEELSVALDGRIAGIEADIQRNDSAAGRMSAVLRLLVILVIPASAIYFHRRQTGNQLREATLRMDAQVEAERQLNRAKDEFIAGMSHEIRTPLTAITGWGETLVYADDIDDETRRGVAIILKEARNESDAHGA